MPLRRASGRRQALRRRPGPRRTSTSASSAARSTASSARTAPESRRSGKIIAGRAPRRRRARSWSTGDGRLPLPARCAPDGVTIIAQEPTLVPHRSVLDNVFLGIEHARPASSTGARCGAGSRALVDQAQLELPANRLARHAPRRGSAEGRDPAGARPRREARGHGRADLGADAPTRRIGCSRSVRRLQARGTTIVYVSHFLEEVLALVDTVTVLRDGQSVRDRAGRRGDAREPRHSHARAHDGPRIPEKVRRRTMRRWCSPSATSLGPRAFENVSFDIRAGEILGLAGSIGSGRSEVARAIFGADRRTGGRSRSAAKPLRMRSPRHGDRRGCCDAAGGPQGARSADASLDRRQHDAPPSRRVSDGGVLNPRRERRAAVELMERVDVRARASAAKVMHAVRRQPAEGAVRQVAFPAAPRLHRRRAHAWHRRRREARDLRADPLARRARHGRPAHLLGARGGAGPRAPRARHAGGADRRRARPDAR